MEVDVAGGSRLTVLPFDKVQIADIPPRTREIIRSAHYHRTRMPAVLQPLRVTGFRIALWDWSRLPLLPTGCPSSFVSSTVQGSGWAFEPVIKLVEMSTSRPAHLIRKYRSMRLSNCFTPSPLA